MNSKQLAVVMPVYNEEECIQGVAEKWMAALNALGITFDLKIYNDGSKDQTLKILQSSFHSRPNIQIRDKPNSGHGPTILTGYRESIGDYEWIFQIDSDDEMGPEHFSKLWEKRNQYDFLIGRRVNRGGPVIRQIMTFISYLVVRILCGNGVRDINSPYRLMRVSAFHALVQKIPPTTFAPNILISAFANRNHLRIYQIDIPFTFRQTGEVSIKRMKLLKVAIRSFKETISFLLFQRGFP